MVSVDRVIIVVLLANYEVELFVEFNNIRNL